MTASPAAPPPTTQSPATTQPAPAPTPVTPPPTPRKVEALYTELTVEPWPDPVIERHGHDPRSAYVETFWLPVLGPSTTWFLRRIATGFDSEPDGYSVRCADMSRELGLGESLTRNSSFVRAVDRACKFGMAQLHGDTMYVRRRVAPLADRQVNRLPNRLRRLHESWVEPSIGESEYDQTVVRSRRLALTLLELGEDLSTAEHQLHAWHFHPSVAFDAAHWAMQRHQVAAAAAERQNTERQATERDITEARPAAPATAAPATAAPATAAPTTVKPEQPAA